MSKTIDERVVEMRFDNKGFEDGISKTLSSLEKLKTSLKFNGISDGLNKVMGSIKSINFAPLHSAIETVKVQFNALATVATAALTNITNSVVNTGKQLLNSLTLEPVMTGFQEYETQINAVQTILANTSSKGTTLDQVNDALDELNHYADLTIYNFTEMTRNIGTFTAAGVDLNTSVSAIQGIANLAAVSGSTSQQASTAMYQLSQALAAGTVKLMDWNSVVNAGMGGEVFQNALKKTARAHGIAVDEIIEANGSFRDSLEEGWLTAEVLTETLKKFTKTGVAEYLSNLTGISQDEITAMQEQVDACEDGSASYDQLAESMAATGAISKEEALSLLQMADTAQDAATKVKTFSQLLDTLKEAVQSGWTQSWEIIIGDFEEAKKLLTSISDVASGIINAQSDARNKLLEGWKEKGGRTDIIDGLRNAFITLSEAMGHAAYAFRKVFPATTAQQLKDITGKFKSLTENFKLNNDAARVLKRNIKGVFSIIDLARQAFSAALTAISPLVSKVLTLSGAFLTLTGKIGLSIYKFNKLLKSSGAFKKIGNAGAEALQQIFDALDKVIDSLRPFFDEVSAKIQKIKKELSANDFEKVKKALSKIHDIAVKLGNAAAKYLKEAAIRLKEFIESSGALEKIKEEFSKIVNYVKDLINKLKNVKSFDDVVNIFKDVKTDAIEYFAEKATEIKETIVEMFDKAKAAISNFKDSTTQHLKEAGENVNTFKGKVAELLSFLSTKFDNIGFGEVFTVAFGVGMIATIKKLSKALSALADPLEGISDLIENFGGILEATKKVISAYALQIKSKALLNVAIAIGVLAASITVLSLLDTGKMWGAIGALAALSALLIGLSAAMGAVSKIGGTNVKVTGAIVGIAAALLILTISLKTLDGLNSNRVWTNVGVLTALAVGLSALCIILSRLAPQMSKGSISMIAVATAISKMVKTLKEIDQLKINNPEQVASVIVGIAASLALVSKACNSISLGSAVGILAIVLSLKLFLSVFKEFSEMDIDNMKSTLKSLSTIMVLFSALIVSTKFAGNNAVKAGVAILAISGALVLMMAAFKIMATMSQDEISQATKAVSQLLVVFGIVVALSKFAGENATKAGAMLLMMSASLAIIAGVMVILAQIDPDGLSRALVAITTLEFMFAGLIAVTKLAENCKGTLITLAATIAVLAVALGALSMINSENLKAASVSLALVMGMLALIIASTKLAKDAEGVLVMVAIVVASVGGVLYAIASLPTGAAMPAAEALSVLLLAMSASLVILSKAGKVSITALGAMAALTLVVAGLAVILGYLSSMNLGSTLEIAESLSLLLLSLSAACVILEVVGMGGAAAFVGIGALATLIVAIGGLMAGIGALVTYFPNLEEFVTKGISLLNSIGYGLGSFVSSAISGLMAGATDGLPTVADNLAGFMDKIQPFCDGASSFKEESLNGIKNLSSAILSLTGANLVEKIGSWFSGGRSLSSFADQLAPLGTGLTNFANSIKDIDDNTVKKCETASEIMVGLSEMASNIPNSGGVISWFTGNNDMSTFAEQLEPFGRAMKKYSNAVTGLDEGAVNASASAGQTLAELANNLPNSGGFLGDFFGENDIDTFGTQILSFGRAIKQYSYVVTGLDEGAVNASASAGQALAELANNLPNSGGTVSKWFFGEKNMQVFGAQILSFGRAIKAYSNVVAGMNTEAVTASADAGKTLAELASTLPKTGGTFSNWFFGEQNLSEFGRQLSSFGLAIKLYASYVDGLSVDVVTNSANAAQALVELANNLPSAQGIFSWATGKNDIESFGEQIKSFGSSMADYYTSISEIKTGQFGIVTAEFKSLLDLASGATDLDTSGMSTFAQNLTNLGNAGVQGFIDSFTNATSNVKTAAEEMMSAFISGAQSKQTAARLAFSNLISECLTTLKNKYEEFKSVGGTMMINLIGGVKSKAAQARSSFVNIISDCLSAIRSKYEEFRSSGSELINSVKNGAEGQSQAIKDALLNIIHGCVDALNGERYRFEDTGRYFVEGLEKGVNDNRWKVEKAAREMAKSAADAAKKELDIHSPSKVGYSIGNYFGMGFVNSLHDYADKTYDAGSAIATSAKEGLSNAVSKIGEFIQNGIDSQPTIRPVLDLSDVTRGAGRLSAILSRSQAMSINESVNRENGSDVSNNGSNATAGNSYVFTQNNYSPKSLSRAEIYRQTKNQFSAMERMVGI